MISTVLPDVDFIHELQLRRWAREHFVPAQHRDPNWHPIILNEMSRRDSESDDAHLAS
jgi:hypothetical protein